MTATSFRAVAMMLLVAGCAASTPNNAPRGDRSRLTQEQMVATSSPDVYGAVEKLRPEWFTTRGPSSVTNPTPSMPSVFMNGQMLGTIEYLKEIRVSDISEVRFWAAGPASARFGMGHPRGVIEVTGR